MSEFEGDSEMATSGDFTRELAHELGLPETMLATLYRRLREAGLVPKTGRGPKASTPVNPKMAATFLAALGGRFMENEPVKDVIAEWRKVKSTQGTYVADFDPEETSEESLADTVIYGDGVFRFGLFDVPLLEALEPGHTLEEALEALIESYMQDPTGPEDRWFHDHWWQAKKYFEGYKFHHYVQVSFFGPMRRAEIEVRISAFPDSKEPAKNIEVKVSYDQNEIIEMFENMTPESVFRFSQKTRADFHTTRTFSSTTLEGAARIIDWDPSDEEYPSDFQTDSENEGIHTSQKGVSDEE